MPGDDIAEETLGSHKELIQLSMIKGNLFLLRVAKHNYFSVLIIPANRKPAALFKESDFLLDKDGQ